MVSRIAGTGHHTPERVLTNTDLEKMVDTSDEWIVSRTGIRERRIAAEGESTSDMATAAAKGALDAAGILASELDLIIVATVTPDHPLPATAMFVQQKLGATCPAFDMSAACAGFIYGLSVADQFIRSGFRNVLVIGVELLSRVLNWEDRNTCVLFGDGAGAVVLSPTRDPERGLLSTHLGADGSLASSLWIPAGGSVEPVVEESLSACRHKVHMAGQDIFKFAVRALSSSSMEALRANGIAAADVDWVVPHQANLRILQGVSSRVGIPMERFYLNLEKYGNTSSASVPIALDEAVRDGSIQPGQTLLLCALGAGIAWGSAVLRW
ncbi:MAG: ketoacyl-ACP synthase III [Myxococcales bacterium]|nr:ketoacyl-ACP synthase III [Myxococcales bacterium]